VIGLSFLGGSYMCEAFRSGLESVSKGQRESGLSIGLTESQLITNVILPQAFTVSFPAIAANIIFLLKETSVIGILALMELMYLTRDLIGLYYKTNESLFMLVAAYLIIILPVSLVLTVIERRIRYATVGN
jgi:amino acid ABC transporter, permease protein